MECGFLAGAAEKCKRALFTAEKGAKMPLQNLRQFFDVLKIASKGVLGGTEPLRIANPCRFGNAGGDLRQVESMEEFASTADASGRGFREAILASRSLGAKV